MSKPSLRKITVAGNTYLWRVGHYHLEEFEHSPCVDRVTVYLEDHKHSPLLLHFRLEDNLLLSPKTREKDWFMDWGCMMTQKKIVNLNRPGVIAKLIAFYLEQGWNPKENRKPLERFDALKLLDLIEFPEGIN